MYRAFYALFAGSAKCGKLRAKFSLSVRTPFLVFQKLLTSTGEAGPTLKFGVTFIVLRVGMSNLRIDEYESLNFLT